MSGNTYKGLLGVDPHAACILKAAQQSGLVSSSLEQVETSREFAELIRQATHPESGSRLSTTTTVQLRDRENKSSVFVGTHVWENQSGKDYVSSVIVKPDDTSAKSLNDGAGTVMRLMTSTRDPDSMPEKVANKTEASVTEFGPNGKQTSTLTGGTNPSDPLAGENFANGKPDKETGTPSATARTTFSQITDCMNLF